MRLMHDIMEIGVTFVLYNRWTSLYNVSKFVQRWISHTHAAHCSQLRCLDNGSLRWRGLQVDSEVAQVALKRYIASGQRGKDGPKALTR